MVEVFDRHGVRFDPRLAGCSRFVRYSDFVELAAENERLKKEVENWKTSAAGWQKIANVDAEALSSTGAVKVKKLEWQGPFKSGENCSHYDHIYAESVLGRYTFDWKGWKKFDPPTSTDCPGNFFYSAHDLDDAKAAAQADYELRILSALEPSAPSFAQELGRQSIEKFEPHPRDTNTVEDHETGNVRDKPEIGKCGNCGTPDWVKGDMPTCDDSYCTFPYWEATKPEGVLPVAMVEAALLVDNLVDSRILERLK